MKTFPVRAGEIVSAPDFIQSVVLTANTGQAFDTPAGARVALFSMNADFWVRYGSTAASIPTTSSTGGSTSSELNPTARDVGSTLTCTGISIISASTYAVGSIAWYKP